MFIGIQVNSSNYNVEYRDGIKSKGDKIGMPCTHSTVYKTHVIPSPRESTTQALYCCRDTQLRSGVHIHVPSVRRLVCLS